MEESTKTLRRDNPEYKELKAIKATYNSGMRKLFSNLPNWKELSRSTGILNVPTDIDTRLKVQADLKRKYGK